MFLIDIYQLLTFTLSRIFFFFSFCIHTFFCYLCGLFLISSVEVKSSSIANKKTRFVSTSEAKDLLSGCQNESAKLQACLLYERWSLLIRCLLQIVLFRRGVLCQHALRRRQISRLLILLHIRCDRNKKLLGHRDIMSYFLTVPVKP